MIKTSSCLLLVLEILLLNRKAVRLFLSHPSPQSFFVLHKHTDSICLLSCLRSTLSPPQQDEHWYVRDILCKEKHQTERKPFSWFFVANNILQILNPCGSAGLLNQWCLHFFLASVWKEKSDNFNLPPFLSIRARYQSGRRMKLSWLSLCYFTPLVFSGRKG